MTSSKAITESIRRIEGLHISKSEESRGSVSTISNEGYKITKSGSSWRISYLSSAPHNSGEGYFARRWIALEMMFIQLSSDGFEVKLDGWNIVIPNKGVKR
jgi:hypothetical protein